MDNKYWLIEMSDTVRSRLSHEQLHLASVVQHDGRDYLLYRDSFVAYKTASSLGATVRSAPAGLHA